ncbi:TolB family protein [Parafilimonas terrae]|uniref:WD40-like Beta Propeller Repeat n=1 Tax=Parafilimonas terrae TaxID=1465490 RepID=A0A1I5RUB4_9BACT|nr:TolB family protein [Parafilimonas terrae]SFP62108.1 WD40-like Beta Propeller Repeat [Parafilimonas terrae]
MKLLSVFILLIMITINAAAQNAIGVFENQFAIGDTKQGSAVYNAQEQEYTIEGSGNNIWFNHDGFQYVCRQLDGDFILRCNASFIGKGVDAHRKLGWMIRSSLDSTSACASVAVHGDGLTSLQYRKKNNDSMMEVKAKLTGADVIQLERRGNTYIMSVAHKGEIFTEDSVQLDLGDKVYAGLFVCAHNPTVTEKAIFYNVRIVKPAPPTLVPYRQYLGSQLEIMNVETGKSRIIYQSPKSLQAPNWMKDGKHLLYNSEGLIYKFDLATNKPAVLNTGTVNKNNNDHVLSFDGKMLGLSSGSPSNIFTVPVEGGEPKPVTQTGPSYLHGWSTDAKTLVFTGQRNDDFNIYTIPATGGKETQLTTAKGLDDGPEYSPDGIYIYFNSARTGTMQLWRMHTDGSNQEQLTNDEFNNWFPHISPDGKWILFISFEKDVDPSDHPFYKHVYIRLMPVEGGKPKVLAALYGGQGTMNTPNWSPDGKYIAFISNSDFLSPVYPGE